MSVIPVRRWRTGVPRASRSAAERIISRIGRAITAVTSPPQKPLPSWRFARRSSHASADWPQRRVGPSGSAVARRGSQVDGRPRLTRSPRIASVAGRKVRLPMTETSDRDRPDRHRGEQRDAEGDQAGQRDHHRQAREEDRAPGRAAGDLDRLGAVAAGPPLDPEPGDHEQRVVDRDGQADQHDQLRRVRADRARDLAVDAQDPERGQERGRRQDERHERRDDRAEGEQQDDERQRHRELERIVEAARDQRVDVVGDERAADGVDRQARVGRAALRRSGGPARGAP